MNEGEGSGGQSTRLPRASSGGIARKGYAGKGKGFSWVLMFDASGLCTAGRSNERNHGGNDVELKEGRVIWKVSCVSFG